MDLILSAGLARTADASTGFPNSFEIDYFRWYQASPSNAPGAPSLRQLPTGSTQVALNWNAVMCSTRYLIGRATTSGESYTVIATNTVIAHTTYIDTSAVRFMITIMWLRPRMILG
jgi:hypothetical protein